MAGRTRYSRTTWNKNQLAANMKVPNLGDKGCSLCADRSIPNNLNAHVTDDQTCADVHLQLAMLRYDNAMCATGQSKYQELCCTADSQNSFKTASAFLVGAIITGFVIRKILSIRQGPSSKGEVKISADLNIDDLPGTVSFNNRNSSYPQHSDIEMSSYSSYHKMEDHTAPFQSRHRSGSRNRNGSSRGRASSRGRGTIEHRDTKSYSRGRSYPNKNYQNDYDSWSISKSFSLGKSHPNYTAEQHRSRETCSRSKGRSSRSQSRGRTTGYDRQHRPVDCRSRSQGGSSRSQSRGNIDYENRSLSRGRPSRSQSRGSAKSQYDDYHFYRRRRSISRSRQKNRINTMGRSPDRQRSRGRGLNRSRSHSRTRGRCQLRETHIGSEDGILLASQQCRSRSRSVSLSRLRDLRDREKSFTNVVKKINSDEGVIMTQVL